MPRSKHFDKYGSLRGDQTTKVMAIESVKAMKQCWKYDFSPLRATVSTIARVSDVTQRNAEVAGDI